MPRPTHQKDIMTTFFIALEVKTRILLKILCHRRALIRIRKQLRTEHSDPARTHLRTIKAKTIKVLLHLEVLRDDLPSTPALELVELRGILRGQGLKAGQPQ
jgi:hypothetical protein